MSATTATSPTTGPNPTQNLSEADFLQLLVTQMTSQDPLDPQSDTEFAAQLAQFTALQQAQTTQNDMATLQANALIGETVTVQPPDQASAVTGVVSGVVMNGGAPSIYMNGNAYPLSQIAAITPTIPASANAVANANGAAAAANTSGTNSTAKQ